MGGHLLAEDHVLCDGLAQGVHIHDAGFFGACRPGNRYEFGILVLPRRRFGNPGRAPFQVGKQIVPGYPAALSGSFHGFQHSHVDALFPGDAQYEGGVEPFGPPSPQRPPVDGLPGGRRQFIRIDRLRRFPGAVRLLLRVGRARIGVFFIPGIDDADDLSDGHRRPFVHANLAQNSARDGGYVRVDLVGGDLHHGLVALDRIAHLLQPADDRPFLDAFAQPRHGDVHVAHPLGALRSTGDQ